MEGEAWVPAGRADAPMTANFPQGLIDSVDNGTVDPRALDVRSSRDSL